MIKTLAIFTFAIPFLVLTAGKKQTIETTLHDFMHDYTKPALKLYKKTGNSQKLEIIIQAIPEFAPEDQKEKWEKISNQSLVAKDFEKSCASCHKPYKKPYKKSYRKRPIQVPIELLNKLK